MKIIINGFRCYIEAEYNIADNRITLIKGNSGCGKTTIYQALYWCLYGSMKNVFNNSGYQKCMVKIEFDKYQIIRQKRPELLRIIQGNDIYEDDVAQQIINCNFGPKEVWLACSYLQQGERSALLSGSNTERMELLNSLSFSMDDPDACIHRIEVELKETLNRFNVLQNEFDQECNRFAEELENNPVDLNNMLTDEEILIKEKEYEREKAREIKLNIERYQEEKVKGVWLTLTEGLNDINKKLLTYPRLSDDDINRLRSTIDDTEKMIKYQQTLNEVKNRKNQLELEISNCEQLLTQSDINWRNHLHTEYTENDVIATSAQDQLFNQNLAKCQELNCVYDSDCIRLKIEKYHEELSLHQQELTKITQKKEIITEIDKQKQQYETQILQQTKNREQQYKQQEQQYRYNLDNQRKQLQLYQKQNNQHTENINRYQHDIKLLISQKNQYQHEINKLSQEITLLCEQFENSDFINSEIETYKHKIHSLEQSLKVLSCPHCNNLVKYHDEKLVPIHNDSSENSVDSDNLINLRNRLITLIEQKETIDKCKVSLQHSQSAQNNKEYQYQLTEKTIKEKEHLLSQVLLQIKESQCNISDSISQIDTLETDLASLLSNYNQDIQKYHQQLQEIQIQCDQQKQTYLSDDIAQNFNIYQTRINNLKSILLKLSAIQIISPVPVKPQVISNLIKLKNYQKQLTLFEQEILQIETSISGLQYVSQYDNLVELKRKYQSMQETAIIIKQLEEQKQQIDNKLTQIQLNPQVETDYSNLITYLKTTELLLINAKHTQKMYKWQQSLENKRNLVLTLNTDVMALQKLKQIALTVECQQLEQTVASINSTLADIFSQIFEDPITVNVQLFKTLKNDKRTKPQVNLSITYKGMEFDNISQLSGGEAARISIGIILSLSRLSGSPILLLDEGFSALNGNLRQLCLKGIRNYLPNSKTVLIISHEDVEGDYDDVLSL